MRVAIVPGVDAASEHDDADGLAAHVRDADLRQRLSVVPEKLTAAEALGTVLELGSPLDPCTILIRLGSYEVLDEDTASLLNPQFDAAEQEVAEQVAAFLRQAEALADAGELAAASNHYRAADAFLRHEVSERRARVLSALAEVERRAGNTREATQLLDEALAILSHDISMLEQRAALANESGESAVAAAMHHRLLAQVPDDTEQRVALCDAIASESLSAARQALEHALGVKRGDRRLLQRLERLLEASEDWAGAVSVAVELAEGIPSKKARARALVSAARLCNDKAKNTARAVAIYEAAIEDDPEVSGGFAAIEAALLRAGDHEGLASAYERQIARLGDAELSGVLLRKLAELYWQTLEDNDKAIHALERLIDRLPSDPNARCALAKILEEEGNDYGAIHSLEIAATLAPRSTEIYRRLHELVSRGSNKDRIFLTGSVLVALGEAEINEQLSYTQHAPEGLLRPSRGFDAGIWAKLLPSHHVAEIDRVMAAVEPTAMTYWFESQAPRLKNLMPSEKSRVNPKQSTLSAVRCFVWASQLLGVDEPIFYVEPDNGRISAATLPTEQPALLLGRHVLSGRSVVELAFIATHHLAYSRGPWRLLAFWTDAVRLQTLLHAAVALVKPDLELEIGEFGDGLRSMLSDRLPPERKDALAEAVEAMLGCGKQLDVVRWARSVEEAACRAALLASGDVTVAASVLAVAGAPVGGQSAADRARDLLPFTVSRQFAALRKQLGIALK
ncbi:MAG TPA: tetratricopeptide repeat protein [Polyangiaceae bacterium]|nr:tetratricopeptide repeat protein [Polyangiaceae bacterium]